MALYDDLDSKQGPDKVAGWSSGIKLLQTQLQVKKAAQPIIQPKNALRKHGLTPVVNLKAKKENIDLFGIPSTSNQATFDKPITVTTSVPTSVSGGDAYSWDVIDEYNPLWPNEYEKLTKDRKAKEPSKQPVNNYGGRNRREYKRGINLNKMHGGGGAGGVGGGGGGGAGGGGGGDDDGPGAKKSGFAGRPTSDDEEEFRPGLKSSGAAIAPPASLQESVAQIPDGSKIPNLTAYGGSSVAAKIMAKYGFRDGQGLGKQEQGMSMALQVEKTSKRGGRIVHEKDISMPPPGEVPSAAATAAASTPPAGSTSWFASEPSITEIMKSPSKVVLLRNMVGPGDVDDELEPEVKDECNTKYGDVVTVVIYEIPKVVPEETVRIFVEFKRMESAIKAVVDLNGRFFGGRQVRAGFYNQERFDSMDLDG